MQRGLAHHTCLSKNETLSLTPCRYQKLPTRRTANDASVIQCELDRTTAELALAFHGAQDNVPRESDVLTTTTYCEKDKKKSAVRHSNSLYISFR